MGRTDKSRRDKQVAALPIRMDVSGAPRVLLMTSWETKRFVILKGWPMKGHPDHEAAAIEAEQESGLIGSVGAAPIGRYHYVKRRAGWSGLIEVAVYLMNVCDQRPHWKEKGERDYVWLTPGDAASLVDEPELAEIIRRYES